ncbi:MAG: response regulator [Candidatus Riflebacteria bacterium]|nr:response regulator [Candidatus Riflebacteria bacterium]
MPDRPVTVLVCDDDEDIRTTLEWYLAQSDYRVITADGGLAALAILARGVVDLVLLDLLMPGMSGMDTLVKIKENPVTRNLPVIVLTAVSDSQTVDRCRALGACDYLIKPVDTVHLKKVFARALAGPPPLSVVSSASPASPMPHTAPVEVSALDVLRRELDVFVKKTRSHLPPLQERFAKVRTLFPDEGLVKEAALRLNDLEFVLNEFAKLSRKGT